MLCVWIHVTLCVLVNVIKPRKDDRLPPPLINRETARKRRDAARDARTAEPSMPLGSTCAALAHCARPAVQSLAPALALRGGQLSRPDFVHSVLLGLLANTAAVHLCTLMTGALTARPATVGDHNDHRRTHSSLARRVLEPAARHLACLLVCFLAYLLTYQLTGFVPMGYVVGTKPRLTIFEAPRPTT